MSYLERHGGTRVTPQSQPIPGRTDQVQNTAGGFVWQADKWSRLSRFLILGSEGGSYYASERTLTTENVSCVRECIAEDGIRALKLTIEISEGGRAPSNDPALFVWATAISLGSPEVKRAAAERLPRVARIGTHLYHFIAYAETMRGWGRTLRWAVQNWYASHPAEKLAYEVIKYRQRDGWSHRDLLRLSHANVDEQHNAIFQWVTHGLEGQPETMIPLGHVLLGRFEQAQLAESASETARLVREHRLPREALKTEHLNEPEVWRALLEVGMPLHAMVRNLATMTRLGIFDDPLYVADVVGTLGSELPIRKSRMHPMAFLIALKTYAQGHGMRGQNTWQPKPAIIDALDEAFYLAFGNVEASGKRTLVSIDVSGSMAHGSVAGSPLTPREAAAALAMVALHTEPECEIIGISDRAYSTSLSKRQRLDDVTRYLSTFPASRTDLSLPWQVAKPEPGSVESFILLTDNETWAGRVHPAQMLQRYRELSGIQARSVGVAMVANRWSIHDPQDALSLDVVGFDTATPQIVSDFCAGRI